jgi:hypothetical protein
MQMYATIKRQNRYLNLVLSSSSSIPASDDIEHYRLAMEGWKIRKEQLHKQQKSIIEINEEAEKMNLLSLSKQIRT